MVSSGSSGGGMLVSPFRLRYRKDAELRFLGHLDTTRLLLRLLRRARLPLVFTAGFSPHPRIVGGPSLPLGFVSDVEFLDFALRLDADAQPHDVASDVYERLCRAQEAQQIILGMRALTEGEPRISRLAATAKYALVFVDKDHRHTLTAQHVESWLADEAGADGMSVDGQSRLPIGLISWKAKDGLLHLHATVGGAKPLALSRFVKRLAFFSGLRFLVGERKELMDAQGEPVR